MQEKHISKTSKAIRKFIPRRIHARVRLGLMQSRMAKQLRKLHLAINGAFVEKYRKNPNPMTVMEKFKYFRRQLLQMKERLDSPFFRNNLELQERFIKAKVAFGFTFGIRIRDLGKVIDGTIKHPLSSDVLQTVPEKVGTARADVDKALDELKRKSGK